MNARWNGEAQYNFVEDDNSSIVSVAASDEHAKESSSGSACSRSGSSSPDSESSSGGVDEDVLARFHEMAPWDEIASQGSDAPEDGVAQELLASDGGGPARALELEKLPAPSQPRRIMRL
mmetsp:Transcript_107366/g.309108  ORF Transcript_107366/g.309108 Transcript_107366/m.309108 type:complete len:120 (-) Transcript_107366:321-680(-)